ncbi:hypothetical protein DPMN_095728 [Dreissena polymorpha]|uniref:Uncharacterized protein n=1 Tax=Dreissena polymorpha TaxID=45954 RepID=A0A9D4L808_DREPO|nr:hypothetical protein DPMN_095728 [Dreissena polymorpha]
MPMNGAAARQQNRPNVPAASPSGYWKLNMYFPLVYYLMSELETAAQPRYIAQHLLPRKAVDITHEVGAEIFQAYQDEILVTRDQFLSEIRICRKKWT